MLVLVIELQPIFIEEVLLMLMKKFGMFFPYSFYVIIKIIGLYIDMQNKQLLYRAHTHIQVLYYFNRFS